MGLPDGQLQDSDRQDPSFIRSQGAIKGRDGARVPLPWSGDLTPFGFSSGSPWLPIEQSWKSFTVENESADAGSVLNLYRSALRVRAEQLTGTGGIEWLESPCHGAQTNDLLVFKRGRVTVVMNLSHQLAKLDYQGEVLLVSSGDLNLSDIKKSIPAYSTIWILN